MNIYEKSFPGSVSPTRLLTCHMGGTFRILACARTASAGGFRRPLGTFGVPSPPPPGLGFLRSVTHAVCPALWADHAVHGGKTVPACLRCHPAPQTSYPLPTSSMRRVKGTPVVFDKRREEKPAVASTAPTCGENPSTIVIPRHFWPSSNSMAQHFCRQPVCWRRVSRSFYRVAPESARAKSCRRIPSRGCAPWRAPPRHRAKWI